MHNLLVIAALDLSGIGRIISRLGGMILAIAPAMIILSYVICALMWVVSGGNHKLVKWAREQFIATTIVLLVLGGYYIVKALMLALGQGGFG